MFVSPCVSLSELLGKDYLEKVCEANSVLGIMSYDDAKRLADEKIDFFPADIRAKYDSMLPLVGKELIKPYEGEVTGAPTDSFAKAEHRNAAPLRGVGPYRLGENGKLYLIGKSEHYHASLGHSFAGYRLIDNARRLGIPNATHNNTRGYITRLAEEALIKAANAGSKLPEAERLSRVINLETGSLAVEAGLKMMLMRFYRLDRSYGEPKYSGKIPVFFVMGAADGSTEANYHGTCVITQTLRGMWPEFYAKIEQNRLYKVVPVRINDISDFKSKLDEYNSGDYKTAGFLHEIVMMNYGGIRLSRDYLRSAYELCHGCDTPVLVDEIQTCMWYDGGFLFRQYGLSPDFAVVGKGFPGGEFPASKILVNEKYDKLNQFGALVTNGQEELASLAYLITMEFMRANGKEIDGNGEYFAEKMRALAEKHPDKIEKAEGLGLLASLFFKTLDEAAEISSRINARCIDTSAQLYKASCPPAILFKPPLISSKAMLDYLISALDEAIGG